MTDKPKRKSLWMLTQEENELFIEIDDYLQPEPDENGVFPEDSHLVKKYMAELEASKKIDRMLHIVEAYEHAALLCRAEHEANKEILGRSQKAALSAESNVKRLKAMIKTYMEETGKTVMILESGRGLKICKNGGPASVHLPDHIKYSLLDDDLYNVMYEVDKDAVRKAEAEGRELPEGFYTYRGSHLKVT